MDTYNSIQQRFGKEDYLSDITNRGHRIALTKLRISNHRLVIETGRFNKITRNERLCRFCKNENISDIEDEKHVLFRCIRFYNIRNELFASVKKHCFNFDSLNEENQFIYHLNSSGAIVKEVSRYFYFSSKVSGKCID